MTRHRRRDPTDDAWRVDPAGPWPRGVSTGAVRGATAGGPGWLSGHHVLVVPVPALEPYVVDRTRHQDASFLSAEASFVHAHVTLLAPWLVAPTRADLDVIGAIASAASPFEVVLDDVRVFGDGTIYLRPEPEEPFTALTAALVAAFPTCPPYAGRHRPTPHLTVDRLAADVTVNSTQAALGPLLPAVCRADRVVLQWYANHGCRTVAEWELGPRSGPERPPLSGSPVRPGGGPCP